MTTAHAAHTAGLRQQVEVGKAMRAGLLATNSIRGGANRTVLERIKETGDIFWAQSTRDWIVDGADGYFFGVLHSKLHEIWS